MAPQRERERERSIERERERERQRDRERERERERENQREKEAEGERERERVLGEAACKAGLPKIRWRRGCVYIGTISPECHTQRQIGRGTRATGSAHAPGCCHPPGTT